MRLNLSLYRVRFPKFKQWVKFSPIEIFLFNKSEGLLHVCISGLYVKESTLDLILTNLDKFYQAPQKLPPFGLSDHFTIFTTPKLKDPGRSKIHVFQVRDQHPRNKAAISTFITEFDWSVLDSFPSCDEKWSVFESIIRPGMDILLPTKTVKKYLNESPWMTQHLKSLIRQRQKAVANGRNQLFKSLRNRVNRERKQCPSKYFDSKVSQLKVSDPKQW